MGSTGSGSFTDYSGTPKAGTGTGASGGTSGEDICSQAFSAALEDVAQYGYFHAHQNVPPVHTVLNIVLNGRLIAMAGNEAVGALPTKFNYLAGCIEEGFSYKGTVTFSVNGANPQVHADFAPI